MSDDGKRQPAEPVEIELKLGLAVPAMDALLASPILREHAQSAVRPRELRSTYYDTPDHRLRSRSAVLRVREAEGRYIQTLKSARGAKAALAQRNEWEVEIDGPRPRPEAFDDPAALDVLGSVPTEDLAPVFETRVRRRSLLVDWADSAGQPARIELAFDDGRVVADGREEPIAELELELLQGDAAALFGLAEALRPLAPFRIEPLDKSARGWLLATQTAPTASKATAVSLTPDQRVEDALAAVCSAALRHWLANEPVVLDGRDPEGLHQLRVALRRLRSAFALFADALGEETRARWTGELRWLLGQLGPARDLDVLTDELLPPVLKALPEGPSLRAFHEVAQSRRAAAREAVRETLRSQRYADLVVQLAAWIARRGWREGADADVRLCQQESIAGFAAAVLERRHRKVRKRGRHFKRLDAPARHRVRIALKKLRYGIEFFADLFPAKRVERFRKTITRLQNRLGHLNDVSVARRLVHEIVDPLACDDRAKAAALGGGQLVGWHACHVEAQEHATQAAWKRFRKREPFWEGSESAS